MFVPKSLWACAQFVGESPYTVMLACRSEECGESPIVFLSDCVLVLRNHLPVLNSSTSRVIERRYTLLWEKLSQCMGSLSRELREELRSLRNLV